MFVLLNKFLPILLTFLLFAFNVNADISSDPTGQWRSIDDKTGEPKSIIEIFELNGELQGKIIELINPSKPNPLCKKCKGELKDQPITGMLILWGVSKIGEKEWGKGKILDPKKGKTYKVKFSLKEKGQELKVRGYIGSPLLGRNQVWKRVN